MPHQDLDDSSHAPPRPAMPTPQDQERAEHQEARWMVLEESFDGLLEEWLEEHIDEKRLQVWGPPDTSVNPLSDISRQLTTPGLYGVRPEITHIDDAAESLIGPDGFLDEAGFFPKMQQVQYYAVGMGDFLVRFDIDAQTRALGVRLVAPHNVYMVSDDARPDVPTEVWELRLRWHGDAEAWIWAWDVFRLSDPDEGGEPSYKVIAASSGDLDIDGADLSAMFLGTEENPAGRFVGDSYPYRFADGDVFAPWTVYRAIDSGQLWNWRLRRGAFRGTLNAALNWSFAQHAARDASGSTVFVVGVDPPASATRIDASGGSVIQTTQVTPGAAIFLQASSDGGQAQFHESGPGANLDAVSAYATLYEQKQAVRMGLNPSDVLRSSANPMSGAALFISTKGRRDFGSMVTPLFRKGDLRSFRIIAAMLNAAGIGPGYPEQGYSTQYHEIKESPAEEKAEREGLDWDLAHGAVTPVEVVQRRRPGISHDDAIALMVESATQQALVDARVSAELDRIGFVSAPPSTPTPQIDQTPPTPTPDTD
jgi:hypothetical protein